MVDGNAYARLFGNIERAHGNAYAVPWGIGFCAAANGRTYANPYLIGCPAHVAFNHGQDDAESSAMLAESLHGNDVARVAAGIAKGTNKRRYSAIARQHGRNALALADHLYGAPDAATLALSDAELLRELDA